jgi:hypothetical protein
MRRTRACDGPVQALRMNGLPLSRKMGHGLAVRPLNQARELLSDRDGHLEPQSSKLKGRHAKHPV